MRRKEDLRIIGGLVKYLTTSIVTNDKTNSFRSASAKIYMTVVNEHFRSSSN